MNKRDEYLLTYAAVPVEYREKLIRALLDIRRPETATVNSGERHLVIRWAGLAGEPKLRNVLKAWREAGPTMRGSFSLTSTTAIVPVIDRRDGLERTLYTVLELFWDRAFD